MTTTPKKQEELKQPKPIEFDEMVNDICCHPSRDIIAAGDINGQVTLHSYSVSNKNHLLMTFNHHKKSCRAVKFNSDGSELVTASKDKSIRVIDVEGGSLKTSIKKAHENAIYSLLVVDRNFVATGDDEGFLKVWDLRYRNAVMEVHENEGSLTDMIIDPSKRLLLVTSDEGTLTAFDIRKHKMKLQSELMDSGLQSIAAVKNGTKVVCGSEDGILSFFNWGQWGNISDRFPGHPMSVESIVPLTDNIICTGDSEAIRAVHLFPNRFIGVVGDHDGFPVENMTLSHCRRWLASCSHDNAVKFWDVTDVAKQTVDGQKKADHSSVSKQCTSNRKDFFKDLVDDMTEEASASTSKDEESPTTEKRDTDDRKSDSDESDSGDSD